MACSHTYHNPAGSKFVTRVEIDNSQALWPDDLAYGEDRLILNIPNGAGPGTILLQTQNCFADWRVVDTKNLVRSTQRAYTGAASWEEVFVEDGCNIYGRVQRLTDNLFNTDGLASTTANDDARMRALWFPNSANIPTFDRLSIVSGPITPVQPGGYPLRTVADGSRIVFAPPGLCRYFQVSMDATYTIQLGTESLNVIWFQSLGPTVAFSRGFCPAWATLSITNQSGGPAADLALCWNRFPMTGVS